MKQTKITSKHPRNRQSSKRTKEVKSIVKHDTRVDDETVSKLEEQLAAQGIFNSVQGNALCKIIGEVNVGYIYIGYFLQNFRYNQLVKYHNFYTVITNVRLK